MVSANNRVCGDADTDYFSRIGAKCFYDLGRRSVRLRFFLFRKVKAREVNIFALAFGIFFNLLTGGLSENSPTS